MIAIVTHPITLSWLLFLWCGMADRTIRMAWRRDGAEANRSFLAFAITTAAMAETLWRQ